MCVHVGCSFLAKKAFSKSATPRLVGMHLSTKMKCCYCDVNTTATVPCGLAKKPLAPRVSLFRNSLPAFVVGLGPLAPHMSMMGSGSIEYRFFGLL